jgi:hypothetical protein
MTVPPRRAVRVFAALAVMAAAGTYLAARIDFVRRHRPSLPPARYWWPQLTKIWAPGLAGALALAAIAFVLHRRGRDH